MVPAKKLIEYALKFPEMRQSLISTTQIAKYFLNFQQGNNCEPCPLQILKIPLKYIRTFNLVGMKYFLFYKRTCGPE